jgi:ATP-dependent Clp protease ATP-binding subunit ClpC
MIFKRFTKYARRCVEAAVEEARKLGHDSVGDEDLLLGVLAVDDGISVKALNSLGVSLEVAREEAGGLFDEALALVGISLDEVRQQAGESFEMRNSSPGRLPFSPGAKRILEQALWEALRLCDNEITDEHSLLGILRDEHGRAVWLLGNLGISTEAFEVRME